MNATNSSTTTRLFADWAVDPHLDAPAEKATPEELRKQAHVVNGGEQTFKCPSCKGSGRFVSYAGRVVGDCFKCKGKGSVGRGVMAAAKGKETKERNRLQWLADHAAEVAYVTERADRWEFAHSMAAAVREWGRLTDNQLAAVQRAMARDAARKEERKAEREAARPVVDVTALVALFNKAVENDHKKPVFRGAEVTVSRAPDHGKNPGALYVTATVAGKAVDGQYLGKVVNGKWDAKWGTDGADTLAKLLLVAADPSAEAMRYASKFSACSVCGTVVVDPVSVRSVVGPVCAKRFGLEFLREAAREELKCEAVEEQAARERGEVL